MASIGGPILWNHLWGNRPFLAELDLVISYICSLPVKLFLIFKSSRPF